MKMEAMEMKHATASAPCCSLSTVHLSFRRDLFDCNGVIYPSRSTSQPRVRSPIMPPIEETELNALCPRCLEDVLPLADLTEISSPEKRPPVSLDRLHVVVRMFRRGRSRQGFGSVMRGEVPLLVNRDRRDEGVVVFGIGRLGGSREDVEGA